MNANINLLQRTGLFLLLIGLILFSIVPFLGTYQLTKSALKEAVKQEHLEVISTQLAPMVGKKYTSNFAFIGNLKQYLEDYNDKLKAEGREDEIIWDDYSFSIAKSSSIGWIPENKTLLLLATIGIAVFGSLLYIFPMHRKEPAGIKNNGVFHSSMKSKGVVGIVTGSYLILLFIVLYWFPEYLANLTLIVDPISMVLSGNPAGQWFLYGIIYTLAILVMGIRMFRKYKGNKYQTLRTASVMFFQLSFAFLIPEILVLLNKPWHDFKNIWPLDYTFFFDYRIEGMLANGSLGFFMLIWGIILIIIGVPLLTYIYGKRWYCSWVCGCGGLAETAGDPYRQLSDKSLKAWSIERIMVHSVLVLAVVMTGVTIVNYFMEFGLLNNATKVFHSIYGFAIGSAFAGVIGTGFYPLMGNRVWCRYGCPLAAYIGIVQRFKSRFRITTNGGQCISCGNCSTYCEMGIDVRWYAQRGQNVVRASCVGCGICSAVCPRGVLKLENASEEGRINENPLMIGNDSIEVRN